MKLGEYLQKELIKHPLPEPPRERTPDNKRYRNMRLWEKRGNLRPSQKAWMIAYREKHGIEEPNEEEEK